MLNLLARNRGSKRWLGLCLFAIAFLCVALVSGCGGSGSSGSGGGAPAKEYSNVIFHFNDLAGKTLARAVPDGTTQIRFTGSTSSREVLYGPTIRDYAPTITLEKVPVRVTGFVLECLNNKGGLTAIIPVSVTIDGYKDTTVTISESPALSSVVKNVVVNPTSINNLLVGYSESITAIATLSDGQIVDLTPYLTFTSSDPDVATVEQNGYDGAKVTASKGGQTTISGSVLGVTIPKIDVVVNGGVVEDHIGFEPSELQVAPNVKSQSRAFVYFNDKTKKNLDSSKVTYSVAPEGIVTVKAASTTGPAICEVTGAATASVGQEATVTMTATLSDGSTQTADMKVKITDSVPQSLSITNDTTDSNWPTALGENRIYSSGSKNSSSQFKAEVIMSNGTKVVVTDQVTWTSSNPGAAKFDDVTVGKLQAVGVAPASTNVTASFNGIGSNKIAMSIISPSVEKLEITSIENLEAGVTLTLDDSKTETDAYAITVKATYGNGDVEYPTIEGGLIAQHIIYTDTVSDAYLRFEDTTPASNNIYVYGKKLTSELGDATWMKFTYKGISTDKVPIKVVADKLKVLTVNFVDQTTGKSYGVLKKTESYELAVPFGRKYTISLHGQTTSGKDMGEISGSYYYAYFPSYDKWNLPPTEDNLSKVSTVGKSNPLIISGMITDKNDPNYLWSETGEVASLEEGYDSSSFTKPSDKRGEHRYNYTDPAGAASKGEIIVVARSKSDGEEAFRVKLYFAEPAVDKYVVYSYGSHSRRGDDVTFDIPRGTKFELGVNQQVLGIMSDIDSGTREHRIENISPEMTVDASSVDMNNTFILDNPSANVFTSVDSRSDYDSCNNYNLDYAQMKGIVVNNKWDEEGNFGQDNSVGKWLSYNCENPGFIFRLERPIVTAANVKVLDSDENDVTPDAKGRYHFKQGEKFYCYYANVATSDQQEVHKDLKVLSSTSELLGFYIDKEVILILQHMAPASNTSPYLVLTNSSFKDGYTSSVTLTPDVNCYYDSGSFVETKNIVLDIP